MHAAPRMAPAVAALLVAAALAGCTSADSGYGLSGLIADVAFDDPLDPEVAREGLAAAGFPDAERTAAGGWITGTVDGAALTVGNTTRAEWALGVHYTWPTEWGLDRDDVRPRAGEKWNATYEARTLAYLTAFEDATGATASREPRWTPLAERAPQGGT